MVDDIDFDTIDESDGRLFSDKLCFVIVLLVKEFDNALDIRIIVREEVEIRAFSVTYLQSKRCSSDKPCRRKDGFLCEFA